MHIIWELIKHAGSITTVEGDSHKRYIMQVWFSTTWSEGTESAVNVALASLLSSPEKRYHSELKSIFEYWHNAPIISLKEARTKVTSFKNSSGSFIGYLKKKQDRIAMAKYQLTGDFGTRKPVCGSIVMLDCPDGTPPLPVNENIFSALSFTDIMKIAKENSRLTILDAAEAYTLTGITKLVSWCGSNSVRVELRCTKVEDIIEEIASVRPWTMSWSNVLDYVDHTEFHRMVRECSKHSDTIHFGYSMNWSSAVWGTCLIDFAGEAFTEMRKELLDESNKSIDNIYRSLGWDSYFRFPLPQNPINTVARMLEIGQYRKWIDYFFSIARQDGLVCQVANVEHSSFTTSPLSLTGGSTVALTWTYDSHRYPYIQSGTCRGAVITIKA